MKIIDKKQPPNAIGIIALEGLNQLVCSSFMVPALKEAFPKVKIYLFSDKNTARHAFVFHYDRAYKLSKNNVWARAKLFFLSKIKKIDNFIDLNEEDWSAEKYLLYLVRLGLAPQKLNFKLKIKAQVYTSCSHDLIDKGVNLKKMIVVDWQIYDSKDFSYKNWDQFGNFIKTVMLNTDLHVVIMQNEKCGPVTNLQNNYPQSITVWDKEELFEKTVAMISQARALVGMDGLWGNIARQLGIPTISLHGPSHSPSKIFLDMHKNLKIMTAKIPCSPCQRARNQFDFSCRDNVCMKTHSPQEVFQNLNELINF